MDAVGSHAWKHLQSPVDLVMWEEPGHACRERARGPDESGLRGGPQQARRASGSEPTRLVQIKQSMLLHCTMGLEVTPIHEYYTHCVILCGSSLTSVQLYRIWGGFFPPVSEAILALSDGVTCSLNASVLFSLAQERGRAEGGEEGDGRENVIGREMGEGGGGGGVR
ncbi:hypothetical protein EYF80_055532 [Liparis tanakae]|uniref:Uncharacterized protein n=1 Tax=Liparis tanakae TaxID=230148 RepID=A0A4Z2EZU8_9TELE|nr:hypothetical protein EYF80_055532 [Liparis tanakae]